MLGAGLRLWHLGYPLEYDEIWTYEQYASGSVVEIFTRLETPNNHPLNSLIVKLMTSVAGPQPISMRMPAALAGILTLPLLGWIALRLTRRRSVALWSMFFLACSAPAAQYAQCARGYEYQLLLLLGVVGAQLMFNRGRRWSLWAIPLLGALSILTLPTSVLFLLVPAFCHWWPRRRNRALFLSYAVLGVFALLYFSCNYTQFRAGQTAFGEAIETPVQFGAFVWRTLSGVTWWPLLLLALPGLGALRAKRGWCVLLTILLPLALALLSRAGGTRVYLPLVAPLALGAGAAAAWLGRRPRLRLLTVVPLALGVVGYAALLPEWSTVHWGRCFEAARRLPPTTLVIYTGNETLPMAWNNPELGEDTWARISCAAPGERSLVQGGGAAGVNGVDQNGNEVVLKVPGAEQAQQLWLDRMPARRYRLLPLRDTPEPGQVVLYVQAPEPIESATLRVEPLRRKPDWLQLNFWFNQERQIGPRVERYFLLATTVGAEEAELWPELLRRAPGKFYRVVP